MVKTKTTTTKKPKEKAFSVSLSMAGRKFEAKGSTLAEALCNLKVSGIARSKVVVTASNGSKTVEKIMMPFNINRLISLSPSMKQAAIKQVSLLFNL